MATSNPEHREPKPSVLSQLLAAQSMLHVLPTPERIGQFISHALKSSLPGCVSGVCFGGQAGPTGDFDACPHADCPAAEENPAGLSHCNCCLATAKGARDFPLATLDRFYGHLLVKMQDPEELALYEPFLTNLANAISLTLENKWQREQLELRTEQRVEESEGRFRTLVEQAADAFFLHDRHGRFIDVNQRACESLGYSREELLSMSVTDVDNTHEQADVKRDVWETLSAGNHATLDGTHRRKDGSTFPVEVRLGLTKLSGQSLVLGLARDITERKLAADELDREKRFSEAVIDAIPGTFFVWSEEGNIVRWNKTHETLYGYTGDEIREMSMQDWFGEDELELIGDAVRKCFEEGVMDVEAHPLTKDGLRIPSYFTARRLDVGGQRYMVGVGVDITERKLAEAEREKLIAKLETQNAELERFTYTVSHDLRSPLITIKGYTEVLREDLAEGESEVIEDDLARISSAADKMDQLLSDLLDLSRTGRVINAPQSVSLEELAQDAIEIVGGQAKQNGVQVDISPHLPVVFGDRVRLLEVLQNLIDNAVKYMGDQSKPRVEIGSRQNGNQAICYVRDNGIGIDPRHHEQVFGLFDQLDPKMEGSGIGLALVKRIVDVHGGRIWIESEGENLGSTFCFTIPEETKYREFDPLVSMK